MKKPLQLSAAHLKPVVQLTDALLLVDISIKLANGNCIKTLALVDSGANGYAFIDSSFAQSHSLSLFPTRKRVLNVVDGRESVSGVIDQLCRLHLSVGQHSEQQAPLFVTTLGQYPIILGKAWLKRHNPHIDWQENFLTFNTPNCKSCLPSNRHQLRVDGAVNPNSVPSKPITATPPPRPLQENDFKIIGAAPFSVLAKNRHVEISSVSLSEVNRLLCEETEEEFLPSPPVNISSMTVDERNEEVRQAFQTSEEAGRAKIKALYDIDQDEKLLLMIQQALIDTIDNDSAGYSEARRLYLQGASLEDVEKALAKMDEKRVPTDPKVKVPKHYHNELYAFDAVEGNKLPPHRDCDHKIEIQPGKTPGWGPLYSMSQDELRVLKKWLETNLKKGFIRASSSPASSPVLFAKKPGGGLRFCVDYRALNAITIKNRYPMPLLQETLHRLSTAQWFTKLDVIAGFNKIRIAEGHEWLTAFRTRFGLFETLVTPFGLSNAPATFQARINEVLREYLDVFCTAYIDDVLVYSDTLEEHKIHVRRVLKALGDAGLQLDIDKCEFDQKSVKYLGMIISTDGVSMDPDKVRSVLKWQTPANVKDVQAFIGFANFYRRFIKDFSKICAPLHALTRKESEAELLARNHQWNRQR